MPDSSDPPQGLPPSPLPAGEGWGEGASRASRPHPLPKGEGTTRTEGQRESQRVPAHGRLLGIDFGTKRLGMAICNPEQTISSPLENYTRLNLAEDARHIRRLVQEERIVGLVIGLPVHLSGDEGGKAREARAFGDWIAAETQLPVMYWDERCTSLEAEQLLLSAELTSKQRKARRDMLAAQILLQDFLDGDRQATSFGRLA